MASEKNEMRRKKHNREMRENRDQEVRTRGKFHLFKARGTMDYSLLFIVIFLLMFGLVMVYSASSYEAMLKLSDPAYYFKKQLIATGLGLVVMAIVALFDYHIVRPFGKLLYIISVVLILLVKTGLGISANGATRWLRIGPFSLQPAEVAKLAVIILFAGVIAGFKKEDFDNWKKLASVMGAAVVVSVFVYKVTSNLSSAVIIVSIAFFMLFIASPKSKLYIGAMIAGVIFVAVVVFIISSSALSEGMSFRLGRVKAWLDPTAYASSIGFQTLQALYAIGSGGIGGKGLGQSMQKLDFLPEAQNDMIFSVICEELGLVGAVAIIVLFALLVLRCKNIADNSPDLFGALLSIGVLIHISLQVILNIAVVTNTIPNTGITLPFISYGGTSVVFLLIEIGLVLSVSRRIVVE